MNRLLIIGKILVVTVILSGIFHCSTEKEVIHLFNGKDLDGFYVLLRDPAMKSLREINEDPNNVITVQNGMIRVSGQEWGHFITNEVFENYRLVVEWRWGEETWEPRKERARDSGILVHCVPPDKIWNKSIESQIIEGGTGDFILVDGAKLSLGDTTRTSGRFDRYNKGPWEDIKGFRHKELEVENPLGEWNTHEVICDGDEITYIINGTVVNEGYDADPHKGQILFQSEGAEIFFRRIDLYLLKK